VGDDAELYVAHDYTHTDTHNDRQTDIHTMTDRQTDSRMTGGTGHQQERNFHQL